MSAVRKVSPLLGESYAIEKLRDFIVGVSILNGPVLLTGQCGTGKSLAASKIHAVGRCAGLSHTQLACAQLGSREVARLLFEGESGSDPLVESRELASCYLADVEHLTPDLTERLMEYVVVPEEGDLTRPRLIFGSRLELEDLFTETDLNHAFLEVISNYHTRIPPLAERIEDVPILCSYQIWINSPHEEYDERWEDFKDFILPDLMTYQWPGNVQELIEVTAAYCGLSGADASEDSRGSVYEGVPAMSADAFYLQQTFQAYYEEFLQTFELERLSGAQNLVIPDCSSRGSFLEDVN